MRTTRASAPSRASRRWSASGPGLERVDASRRAELRQRDARELLRRVGEDAECGSGAVQPAERLADRRRRAGGRRARGPRRSARAGRASCSSARPAARRRRPVVGQCQLAEPKAARRRPRASRARAGACPRAPSRSIATAFIARASRRQASRPIATPTASIATSTGDAVAARDEVLVELVGRRVGDAGEERGQLAAERPQQQGAEHAYSVTCAHFRSTVSHVAETGAEARDRREREDHRRPEDDGEPDRGRAAIAPPAAMLVSRRQPASGKGIRCKSGTVPPL